MGIFCEQTYEIPRKPEYSYTKFDRFKVDNQMENTVKLVPKLLNINEKNTCQIKLIIFTNSAKTAFKQGGTTDEGVLDKENNTMNFQKFFIMDYIFEKEQPIEFVITGSIDARIRTSLASIMGSRGQTFQKKIKEDDDIILEIKGFSYGKTLISTLNININMEGELSKKGLTYEIYAKGTEDNPQNQLLYKSEGIKVIGKKKDIYFMLCSIPDIYISQDGNYKKSLIYINFYDAMHAKWLGKYDGPLSNLVNKEHDVDLKEKIKAIIKIDAIKNYSFIDYLRGGMQINLTVAIDFTGSNGPPDQKNSLHYIGAERTQYEIAIEACGNIVGYYDYDQKFPAFGFGAKFYGNPEVSNCFPLNGNPSDPEIQGIDGILEAYRETLNNVELWGPTNFHYIIDKLNETVKQEIAGENYNNYNILMILTDGIIDDMDDTINSLVEASFLPISVIIIGIGNADFSNMDVLDADEDPLFDKNNRKADRDLVQFVPFKEFKNDGQKLAEQVLEEVPRQIVEFYQHKKIAPGDPVVNIKV